MKQLRGNVFAIFHRMYGYEWRITILERATIASDKTYRSEKSAIQAAKAFAKRCDIKLIK